MHIKKLRRKIFSTFSFLKQNIFAEYFLQKNKIQLDKSGQKSLKLSKKTISFRLKFNKIKVINFIIKLNIKIKNLDIQGRMNFYVIIPFMKKDKDKVVDMKEFAFGKEMENDFEEFLPIWKNFWETKNIVTSLFNQIMTSSQLLLASIITAKRFKALDKKCKIMIKKELEAIIAMLEH
ncbi:TPA: hypothetical protein CPT87_07205 [Candidatus Gastranaerophilales bacterium HUM_5]|nr:MAG TPA: hypothetical protein CPT99_09860 [Candidatus Gastranaerophilales bacterium HUM_4]DAA90996.1 MAG TPA: hypothetical protein CPT87_07205 [Candidatus Gastranaerophilales bacterium HUM_5]